MTTTHNNALFGFACLYHIIHVDFDIAFISRPRGLPLLLLPLFVIEIAFICIIKRADPILGPLQFF